MIFHAVVLVFASATLASAQSASPPALAVGDFWITTTGEARVVKIQENIVEIVRPKSACPLCTWVHDKELTLLHVLEPDGKPTEIAKFGFLPLGSEWRLLQFPLEVSKTWRIEAYGMARGTSVPYVVDCTVSKFEDVKTKAGTLKAFRIDRAWRIKVKDTTSPNWKDIVWYSPEAKGYIKFETSARNPPEWELVSYGSK
jgi:hypothetical protein